MLTNDQVAERFKWLRAGKSRNMRTNGDILFSHDTPIAEHVSMVGGGSTILVNGDRYSSTTSSHVNTLGWNHKFPIVSFTALIGPDLAVRQGVGASLRRGVEVVAFDSALYANAYEDDDKYGDILINVPIGATTWDIKGIKHTYYHDRARRGYHRAGSCVLRYAGYDYLCGYEEGNYFVSRLPLQVKTVGMAYRILMPKAVVDQEFLRQGEWFFVKAGQDVLDGLVKDNNDDVERIYQMLVDGNDRFLPGFVREERAYRRKAQSMSSEVGERFTWTGFKRLVAANVKYLGRNLPNSPGSNAHTVTYLYNTGVFLLAGGTVRHSQHRMLKLEPKTVYIAYRNSSLGDWGTTAKVD